MGILCARRLLAGVVTLFVAAAPSHAAEPLTLEAALARIVADHPALQAVDLGRAVLEADAAIAAQRPPLTLAGEAEQFGGTGSRSGLGGTEWTLTLAGVLERGGKRALREALAARRIDAQSAQRAGVALGLLTDGAQRYLDVVAADAERTLARDELRERERWAGLARERSRAGAAPEVVPLMAETAAKRARFEAERAESRRVLALRRLALLWGAPEDDVDIVPADPRALPETPPLASLTAALERNPGLLALAGESRARESQLRLAEAARSTDVSWRAGVMRLEDGDDIALTAGFTVPLQARSRAEPGVRAAQAERDSLALERVASKRQLLGLLIEAHGLYETSRREVERLRDDVLPGYDTALVAAERAWRAGALSPIEWSELLEARLAARRTQLAAAIAARRALIEIQSLTAEPLR